MALGIAPALSYLACGGGIATSATASDAGLDGAGGSSGSSSGGSSSGGSSGGADAGRDTAPQVDSGVSCPMRPLPTGGAGCSGLQQLTKVIGSPVALAVSQAGIYWTNSGTHIDSVESVPVCGGAYTAISGYPETNLPLGIDVDDTSIYWANTDGGTILKSSLAGGIRTTLVSGEQGVWGVVVACDYVYFDNELTGTIERVPIGGGATQTLASQQGETRPLARDATHLYYATFASATEPGTLRSVPLGGGAVTTLATGLVKPAGLSVDGVNAYIGDNATSLVLKVPVGGGPVVTLASGQTLPANTVTDGVDVYWANRSEPDGGTGAILKMPVAGGPTTVLASGQGTPQGIQLDQTSLYWVTMEGEIMKLSPR